MISAKNAFLFLLEAAIWYGFIYYWIYVLKNPVNIATAALVLLVLAYLGTITCPSLHQTDGWKRLFGNK